MIPAFFAAGTPGKGPGINFTTEGATFSPRVEVGASAVISWRFADGSRSSSATPTVNYGSVAQRTATLWVSPWSALQCINLGYTGEDWGTESDVEPGLFVIHPAQDVSAIDGLAPAQSTLVGLTCSGATLLGLDLSDCTALARIEAYYSSLETLDMTGCTALRRVCVEGSSIASIDVSDAVDIEDIRGGTNECISLVYPATMNECWHLCIGNNPGLTQLPPLDQMGAMIDLLLNSSGCSGEVDVSSAFPVGGDPQSLRLDNNAVTSVIMTGRSSLYTILLNDNSLGQAAVDAALTTVDGFGTSGGQFVLSGNTAPSATGLAAVASLQGRGWTVTVDT